MINLDIIEQEILDLEKHDTSYATIERLAWLYIVRDNLQPLTKAKSTGDLIGDEFAEACSNVPIQSLMPIISEHMEAIRMLYPSEYDSIIQKIRDLI